MTPIQWVSILVFVDHAPRGAWRLRGHDARRGFDPCFRGSRSSGGPGTIAALSPLVFRSLFSWITLLGAACQRATTGTP